MLQSPAAEARNPGIEQTQNLGINVVYTICSAFSRPVEFFLRLQFGTRYFSLTTVFFSTMLMIITAGDVRGHGRSSASASVHPFTKPPIGLFSIGSLSKLCLHSVVHPWPAALDV